MVHTMPGMFIVLEGPNGVGKSTIASLLSRELDKLGIPSVKNAEPRSYWLIELAEVQENDIASGSYDMYYANEMALLYAFDRFVNLYKGDDSVLKTLASGTWVVQSRYYYSSLVYQGLIGGIPLSRVEQMNWFAFPPHLVVFLYRDGVNPEETKLYRVIEKYVWRRDLDPSRLKMPDYAKLLGEYFDKLYPPKAKYPMVVSIEMVRGRPEDAVEDIIDTALRFARKIGFLP